LCPLLTKKTIVLLALLKFAHKTTKKHKIIHRKRWRKKKRNVEYSSIQSRFQLIG